MHNKHFIRHHTSKNKVLIIPKNYSISTPADYLRHKAPPIPLMSSNCHELFCLFFVERPGKPDILVGLMLIYVKLGENRC